jgi:hypothetical protein
VEWVVERPGINGVKKLTMLPDFVIRYLDECATGKVRTDGTGAWENLEFATWLTMINDYGEVLASPNVESDSLMRIDWVKSA